MKSMKETTTKVVAGALVQYEDSLLLLRRARDFRGVNTGKGIWEPPGGTVEPGEKVEDALRREVREETGIKADESEPELVTVLNYVVEDKQAAVHRFHVLYAVFLDDMPKITLDDEHDEYAMVRSKAQLDELNMIEELREFIGELVS
jgi:8-oxo-dGTP pyrophosphatase MutT (NUDIX family)